MAAPRIAEETSATIVVNLPEDTYNSHVKRCLKLLDQGGYHAVAMTREYILDMAEQIKGELADEAHAQRLLEHAAQNRRRTDEPGDQD